MGVQQLVNELNATKELEIRRWVTVNAVNQISWYDFSRMAEVNQIEMLKAIKK
jgi:hypothetical protein